LNDLTSEKLSYGHSNGAVEDKKDFMHKITSGASDYTKIDVSNQTINISGDVAIVRQDAELLIDELLTTWLYARDLKRIMAKKIIFTRKGQMLETNSNRGPAAEH
jgi:hypothetical protein